MNIVVLTLNFNIDLNDRHKLNML